MVNLDFGMKVVAVLLGISVLVAWFFRHHILAASVAKPVHDRAPEDRAFADRFYAGNPGQADIAMRAHRVLRLNLNSSLPELYPTTRLDDELDAQLEANPDLFWDLEKQFGIDFEVDDYDKFQFYVNRITTFDDLVTLVQEKLAEKAAAPKRRVRKRKKDLVDIVVDGVPYLSISGLVVVVIGQVFRIEESLRFGTTLFLSGFSIWGFIGGGTMLVNFVTDVRDLIRNPRRIYFWSTLFVVVLMLFFLSWGLFPLWMIIRMYL